MPRDGVGSVSITVGGPVFPWHQLGLPIVEAGGVDALITDNCPILWPDGDLPSGSLMLGLSGTEPGETIDGIEVAAVRSGVIADPTSSVSVDHLVVNTDSLDRTCAEVERVTGHPLKRIREVGEIRQGFHRLGPGGLIVEVVERPGVVAPSLWGFVLTVGDLDAAIEAAHGLIGAARNAVQPGRRIATVAGQAGLGVPIALMSR